MRDAHLHTMTRPRTRIPFTAILGVLVAFGIELWLLGHTIEMSRRHARAIETTATITSEPEYGTARRGRGMFNRNSGYWFDYEFVVNGATYRGHGMKPDRPTGTAAIWYDPEDPSQSVTEPERVELSWWLVGVGGIGCLIAIAKAWSLRES